MHALCAEGMAHGTSSNGVSAVPCWRVIHFSNWGLTVLSLNLQSRDILF